MRVLHIVTAFPRNDRDVITPWLVEMLRRLQQRGHEIEVLTSAYKGGGGDQYAGIPVHRFRYFFRPWENLTHEEAAPERMRRSLIYRVLPLFFVTAGMVAAWRLARRRRYDVIHVHWPLPLALLGWAAQRGRLAPLVTTFYGVELRLVKSSLKVLKSFVAWAARRSNRVVAISSYTADEVRGLVNVPVEVIPYTTSLPSGGPARLEPASSPATVLFVGRLVERKGLIYLLDAIAQLRSVLPLRLVIIGDGSERERLEKRARDLRVSNIVEFRGKVTDEQLQAAYGEADVFVLPSVHDARGDTEGLGVVLLEAMNAAVPVIGSRIGGIVDIVVDGESGLLVPPGDANALAAALRRVLTDADVARRLGQAGQQRVRTEFTWETITARWEAIYRAVVR
jgi:glycosyltransferase involved in cell wall biosynthesis